MAGEVKMLPPNIRVDWIPTGGDEDEGIEDINAPTAEELNAGTNISCAISQNDFTLAFSERDTNDEKSLCDDSNVQTPVYKNYEGSLTAFRDADIENNESVYNQFYELFRTPLQNGYLVSRVGYPADEEYEDGQDVQIFFFQSGDPVNVHNNGEPVKMTVNFFPQGRSSNGYVAVGGSS